MSESTNLLPWNEFWNENIFCINFNKYIIFTLARQLLDDVVEISEIKIRPFDHIDEKDDG